jgi:hypothetical protein
MISISDAPLLKRGIRAANHCNYRWLPAPPHPGYARPCTPHSSAQAEGLDAEEKYGVHNAPASSKRWYKSGYVTVLTGSKLRWGKRLVEAKTQLKGKAAGS